MAAQCDQQACAHMVSQSASADFRHRTGGDRRGHRVVGRRIVFRQAGLEKTARLPHAEFKRRRASLPRWAGRNPLRHDFGLGDTACGRSAAGGMELHPRQRLHGHDHPEGAWGPRLLRARPFRRRDEGRKPQPDCGGDRDGAEFARARRTSDALRHRRATRSLSTAPCERHRNSLFRLDRTGSGIGRGIHPRHRHRLLWRA